eukprot:bmy_13058T0
MYKAFHVQLSGENMGFKTEGSLKLQTIGFFFSFSKLSVNFSLFKMTHPVHVYFGGKLNDKDKIKGPDTIFISSHSPQGTSGYIHNDSDRSLNKCSGSPLVRSHYEVRSSCLHQQPCDPRALCHWCRSSDASKKTAIAMAHCKWSNGLIRVNGTPGDDQAMHTAI